MRRAYLITVDDCARETLWARSRELALTLAESLYDGCGSVRVKPCEGTYNPDADECEDCD